MTQETNRFFVDGLRRACLGGLRPACIRTLRQAIMTRRLERRKYAGPRRAGRAGKKVRSQTEPGNEDQSKTHPQNLPEKSCRPFDSLRSCRWLL